MTEQDLHIIESYLHGRLTGAEKQDFEQRIKTDPDLRFMLGQMRDSIIAIRQSALDDKLAMLKEEEKIMSVQKSEGARIRPLYQWVAAAAAVLLIAIFLIRPLLKEDDTIKNTYLAAHFDEYVLHSTNRGTTPDPKITPEQERAYNLYRLQKFHKAIPYLEKLWEEKRDTLSYFYLNVSRKAIGGKSEFSTEILKRENYKELMSKLNK